MFDKLKRFLQGAPPPIAERIDDPILGTLTWSEEDDAWVSSATHSGVDFEFQISGTPEPDKTLLSHATDILRRKDEFTAKVLAYVKSEGETVRSLHSYRDEIAGLRIERVCLFWPNRPDDGMISLSGGRDYRQWRCDYIARKPQGLGFDS
ncbi:MAG: hypothetical protein KDK99_18120 [Verrucomicrobiales bacterium]|nr:hypothetical protein [Verrucomicrobiales bacterium]